MCHGRRPKARKGKNDAHNERAAGAVPVAAVTALSLHVPVHLRWKAKMRYTTAFDGRSARSRARRGWDARSTTHVGLVATRDGLDVHAAARATKRVVLPLGPTSMANAGCVLYCSGGSSQSHAWQTRSAAPNPVDGHEEVCRSSFDDGKRELQFAWILWYLRKVGAKNLGLGRPRSLQPVPEGGERCRLSMRLAANRTMRRVFAPSGFAGLNLAASAAMRQPEGWRGWSPAYPPAEF
jgi:hypothetical protein